MPKNDKNILKDNHKEKSAKVIFICLADMKSLLEKLDTCHNSSNKLTTKINNHTVSGYSLFMYCSFDATKGKHDY